MYPRTDPNEPVPFGPNLAGISRLRHYALRRRSPLTLILHKLIVMTKHSLSFQWYYHDGLVSNRHLDGRLFHSNEAALCCSSVIFDGHFR